MFEKDVEFEKRFCQKKRLGQIKILVLKCCWSKIILGPRKLSVEKFFGPKISLVKKIWYQTKTLGQKKILSKNNCGCKKDFVLKKILGPEILRQKNFRKKINGSHKNFGSLSLLFSRSFSLWASKKWRMLVGGCCSSSWIWW